MKKIKYILLIMIVVILLTTTCFASDYTKDDVKINYNLPLSDAVLEKCKEIGLEGHGYLIMRCDDPSELVLSNEGSLGAFPTKRVVVNPDNIVVLFNDSSFKVDKTDDLIYNDSLTFTDCYIYNSDGQLVDSYSNTRHVSNIRLTDYTLIATNKGLYNSSGNRVFFQTALPLGQASYLTHTSIINELYLLFVLLLPVIVGFIAIRKAISFVRGVINRA